MQTRSKQVTVTEHHRRMRDLMTRLEITSAMKFRDDADYELRIREMQRLVTDLKNELDDKIRLLARIPYLEQELANLRDKYESDMRMKQSYLNSAELIRKLQFNLEDASRYKPIHIETPKYNVSFESKPTATKEVVFENNPELVNQLDMTMSEKKRLERELDKAKLDIKDREDECARLRGLIDKLRNGIDKFQPDFGLSSVPDQKNMRNYYLMLRGDLVDKIIDMRNRAKDREVKVLSLRLLQMYKDMMKMRRKYEEANVDKLVLVKNSNPREPIYIWTQLRYRIVHWLFEIFVRSRDESMKYKK